MTKTNWLLTICVVTLIAIGCKSTLYSEGERVYTAYCSNCHMDDGSGLAALIPPLTDMEYLQANITMLPCIITNGMAGPIVVNDIAYDQVMPGAELSDVQLLNLINYIGNEWGNTLGYQTITDVQKWKNQCTTEEKQ